jgi:hypothetical protein
MDNGRPLTLVATVQPGFAESRFAARLPGLASDLAVAISPPGQQSLRRPRLTAPEAVTRLPHCLRRPWSAWVAGPHLVRRFPTLT